MKTAIAELTTGYHRNNILCNYEKSPSRTLFFSVAYSETIDNFILLCYNISKIFIYSPMFPDLMATLYVSVSIFISVSITYMSTDI